MVLTDLKTKQCLFCAETSDSQSSEDEETNDDDNVLFAARPSLLGMAPAIVKGLFFIVLAGLLVRLPLENLVNDLLGLGLTESQSLTVGGYRLIAGFGLGLIVVLVLVMKTVRLKMTYYEITSERVEWSRGILDRRVDNMDMFRVIDLKMRRSVFDCIFGIGTVGLITTDKTDPEFVFEKVHRPRELYDIIKRASLEADRRTGVVHLE